MASNYSFYSIPVFWFLTLYPHAYGISIIKKANNGQWNNVCPRGMATNAQYKNSVSADVYARFERAEATHQNGMENAPFFIGAVLAGNHAGINAATLNAITGAYLGLRILYSYLYINTSRQRYSRLRSLTWMVSTALLIVTYVKAGKTLTSKT